jgi:hypothetical protein
MTAPFVIVPKADEAVDNGIVHWSSRIRESLGSVRFKTSPRSRAFRASLDGPVNVAGGFRPPCLS